MKLKKNFNFINCLKMLFQILKDKIKKKNINLKNQQIKPQQRMTNKRLEIIGVIFNTTKTIYIKQVNKKTKTQSLIE